MTQSSTGWIGLAAVRILVLDDTPPITEEIKQVLRDADVTGEVLPVADRAALDAQVDRGQASAVVVAVAHQEITPVVTAAEVVRSRGAATPIVVVAHRGDDLLTAECMKAGATEYIRRSDISRFPAVLTNAIAAGQARRRSHHAAEELRLRERRFRALVEHSHDAVMLLDAEGTILYASPATTSILGYPLADVIGQNTFRLVHPDDRDAIQSHFRQCTNRPGVSMRAEFRCRHREGDWRFLEGVAVNRLEDPAVHAVIADIRDATDRKRAESALRASEQRYALAARGANDGLWDWDLVEDRVYYSERWKAMLGYEESEVSTDPREWLDRIHPQDRAAVHRTLEEHQEERAPHFESEHRLLHRDGEYRWMLCRGLMVRDERGRPTRMAGSLTDITDRKSVEEQLKYDAVHDALTGLPNRLMFVEVLDRAVARARNDENYAFAVLFIDLDRFKVINDSLGHLIGDQLLIAFARRLERCLRPGDTVARLGGDEFTVLVERVRSGPDATRIADRIHRSLQHPFELRGYEVFTGVSIGIVSSTTGYEGANEVLRDADAAMYSAKAQGRSRYVLFDSVMHDEAMLLLELETDLRRAIERQEFVLHYQPIVTVGTRAVTGLEALVRWQHPQRGLLAPMEFIEVAEETGLIIPIGNWVLREACRQMVEWERRAGGTPRTISVNLSARQFAQGDLAEEVATVLAETGMNADRLTLEITESAIMADTGVAQQTLTRLRNMGVHIHIDDFGSGYSALSYLYRFPIDTLKIDRSFIGNMAVEERQSAIVRAIVTLARHLDVDVIAEGVESELQLEHLRELECPSAQGYLFSRPLDAEHVEALLSGPLQVGTRA